VTDKIKNWLTGVFLGLVALSVVAFCVWVGSCTSAHGAPALTFDAPISDSPLQPTRWIELRRRPVGSLIWQAGWPGSQVWPAAPLCAVVRYRVDDRGASVLRSFWRCPFWLTATTRDYWYQARACNFAGCSEWSKMEAAVYCEGLGDGCPCDLFPSAITWDALRPAFEIAYAPPLERPWWAQLARALDFSRWFHR
jgi:hypothetical protein